MLWYFLAGVALGALGLSFLYISARREIVKIDEEKQLLLQEKQISIEFMHSLVEAIGEGVERNDLYNHIVHTAILSTGALSACVYEKSNGNQLKRVAVEGLFPPQKPIASADETVVTRAKFIEQILKSESFEWGEGLIGGIARSGKGILIANARKDPRVIFHKDPALAVHSIIIVPILSHGSVLGLLAVANPADNIAFNETDFSLVQSLAEQAGMALHNLHLMELQLEKKQLDFEITLASNIQGMLLPQSFPKDNHFDVGACYHPAKKVGGDLYDVFKLPDGRIAVAIADVSGKGIPASLLMAICQTNLRHYARGNMSPAEVLKAINREMFPEMRRDMFITIVYAIIDTKKGEIMLARAGHELPMLLKGSQAEAGKATEIQLISSEGMALGMVPSHLFDSVIEDKIIPFHKHDVLLLYTDGITEAINDKGEEFSAERLIAVFRALGRESAKNINQGILKEVAEFVGAPDRADDLTLLSVKCTQG